MTTFAEQGFIVTGAASGIGLATARALKAAGVRLVLWDANGDGLAKVAAELEALAVPVDITQAGVVEAAVQKSVDALGKLNGVVHAAGILRTGTYEQISFDEQRRVVEVNLIGTLAVAYAVLPFLRQTRGSLVMLASSSAFYGPPEYVAYAATKAGVLSVAQSLRVELAGSGVHIGVVSPLFVNTPMLAGYNGDTRLIRSHSPFFDVRPPEQIAPYILNGIAQRQFMIFPGWRARVLFWMSRYGSALMHRLTLMTYRQGGG